MLRRTDAVPSDRRLGRNAALDPPGRCRRLRHDALPLPTAVFGPPDHQAPELSRHDVETLDAIFTNHMQRPVAEGAVVIFGVDVHLDPREVARQRPTIGPTLVARTSCLAHRSPWSPRPPQSPQRQILRKRLGPSTEPMTLHHLDDRASRSLRVRSVSSIAINVAGSSGSESVGSDMTGLNHTSHQLARTSTGLFYFCRQLSRLHRRRRLPRGVNASSIKPL
jgi:hypothetical protein